MRETLKPTFTRPMVERLQQDHKESGYSEPAATPNAGVAGAPEAIEDRLAVAIYQALKRSDGLWPSLLQLA